MWKKVPRQTTKRGRNSFWRKIEPAEQRKKAIERPEKTQKKIPFEGSGPP
jgi:hypothetical protein